MKLSLTNSFDMSIRMSSANVMGREINFSKLLEEVMDILSYILKTTLSISDRLGLWTDHVILLYLCIEYVDTPSEFLITYY